MQLAEAIQIDGGTLVLILIVLAGLALGLLAALVFGCIWAYRAGQGSRGALVAWLIIACVEGVYAVPVLFGVERLSNVVTLVPLTALVAQVALYLRGRSIGPPPPNEVAPEGDPSV